MAGVRRLVDNVDPVYPDQFDRGCIGSFDFAADGCNRKRSTLFAGIPGPVKVQVAIGMQVEVTAAPGNPDIAGKKCQGVDEARIFTTITIALQSGADKGGRRCILAIPLPQFFDIRRIDVTRLCQAFRGPVGYQFQKFFRFFGMFEK